MITMIEAAFFAPLVRLARSLPCALPRLVSARVLAVHLPDVATTAQVEQPPTLGASAFSERVVADHRSTRAELLSSDRLPCELALVGVRQPDTEGSGWRPWALILFGVRQPEP